MKASSLARQAGRANLLHKIFVQLSRLLDAHKIVIGECRELAERADKLGDDGTNDLAVSDALRLNELQVWFLSEHLVNMPLVSAQD